MKITTQNVEDIFKTKFVSEETLKLQGYEEIETLFCDSSGLGTEGERALTRNQAIEKVADVVDKYGHVYAFITGVGIFQVYLGLFTKTGKNKTKRIANNTLLIDYGNGKRAIRFHETDIITEENGELTLDNGGYLTKTTKDRMNKYLGELGYCITQKNYEWFIAGTGFGLVKFHNGIKLTGTLPL